MEKTISSRNLSLGVKALDESHQAILTRFDTLAKLSDDALCPALYETIEALEKDFREEEECMEKIDFAGLHSHREHHARVLSAFHHAASSARQGHFATARSAIAFFPPWFDMHLSTMDTALAIAMKLAGASTESPA